MDSITSLVVTLVVCVLGGGGGGGLSIAFAI